MCLSDHPLLPLTLLRAVQRAMSYFESKMKREGDGRRHFGQAHFPEVLRTFCPLSPLLSSPLLSSPLLSSPLLSSPLLSSPLLSSHLISSHLLPCPLCRQWAPVGRSHDRSRFMMYRSIPYLRCQRLGLVTALQTSSHSLPTGLFLVLFVLLTQIPVTSLRGERKWVKALVASIHYSHCDVT